MNLRSIDFQGFIDLDGKITDLSEMYLSEKEHRLSESILGVLQAAQYEIPGLFTLPEIIPIGLPESTDEFIKSIGLRNHASLSSEVTANLSKQISKEMNRQLRDYAEILEDSATEFYRQVRSVSFFGRESAILSVVEKVNERLTRRIRVLIDSVGRLSEAMRSFCFECPEKKENLWSVFRRPDFHSDSDLIRRLHDSENFLNVEYREFHALYAGYKQLDERAKADTKEVKNFPIFAVLDTREQKLYSDLLQLLKMSDLNSGANPRVDIMINRTIRQLTGIDCAAALFKVYLNELESAFFRTSIELKFFNLRGIQNSFVPEIVKKKADAYRTELQSLLRLMSRYRLLMLRTDPDPYIRSRKGFSEWIVAAEPEKLKEVLGLIYSGEELDELFRLFQESLAEDLSGEKKRSGIEEKIEKLLHEMGQPLISRSMMQKRAEGLIELLWMYDEPGHREPRSILFVERVLSKAMREDRKYYVLHGFPLFHRLYRLHMGLRKNFKDISHANRLVRLSQVFAKINRKIEKEGPYLHLPETEINDIKSELQNFFASIRREIDEKRSACSFEDCYDKFRRQVLEYRYAFGDFFFKLSKENIDYPYLRNLFMFVDQYFEAIEMLSEEARFV